MVTLKIQEEKTVRTGLFSSKQVVEENDRLVNFYGLLEGKLMSGREITRIATTIIQNFISRKLIENRERTCAILRISQLPIVGSHEYQDLISEKARGLVMKDFYDMA